MSEWAVPGYTELRPLGSGGFGAVKLARHDALGTVVAIKYLLPELRQDPDFAAMFRDEAVALGALDDPHVVRLYEYVEAPEGAAIVMELVDGVSLQQILARQGKTTPEAALVVLYGSLLGLAASHERGVVHRDYKPANVLVNGLGASKLTDFGIAERAGTRQLSAGTLAYAPPEQYEGGQARPSGDVYAATATFYECVTGHPPFTGHSTEALLAKHRSADVPMDDVPAPLRPLVARGLAKDPGRRPADAGALATELRTVAAGAYGEDWEARGRSNLGEAALLLALLWPSAAAPALASATVEHVTFSQVVREATTRLASPQTRTRPLTRQTTKHLLSQAQRHTLHVLHLEHVDHVKHLRRLRNAALGVTGAAVAAAGITVAATSSSHAAGGSGAAAAAHPAVVAYPVSLASTPAPAAAGPSPSPTASGTTLPASCDGWPNNIIYSWATQPVTTASLGQSIGQLIATCTGTVTSVTCSTYFQYEPNDYLCSIPAEVGMPHSSVIYVFPGGNGEWQYTGEGTN